MRTLEDLKEHIKDSIDPVSFYQQEGQEIRTASTREWKIGGLCPFHEDRSIGSFYINDGTGAFKCFACGAKGGDIISFLQKRDDLSFIEATRTLSQEWRVN